MLSGTAEGLKMGKSGDANSRYGGHNLVGIVHCKYIDRKYYDILSCLIYHSNLVIICTGRIQPMIVPSTAIPWFQPDVNQDSL